MQDGKAAPHTASGRLNAFQRSMLQWNSMHPYNAVHVVRVPGQADQGRLRRAVTQTIEAHSLTGLTLNNKRGTYSYRGGATECEIRIVGSEANAPASLAAEIERQLNTPFKQADSFSPFRFFVSANEASFFLGLAYLHAVADGEAIVFILKAIVENYAGPKETNHRTTAGPRFAQAANALLSHPGAFARKLASLPSFIKKMRSSCRPPCRDTNDLNNKFTHFWLKSQTLDRLVGTGKSWGVTVNDVLLALLIKSCLILTTKRGRTGRRSSISIGCIVNTRKDLKLERDGALGLFLGSFVVTHAVPEELTLADLAKDIGRQTLEIKRKKLYLATPLELSFGRFMFSFFSTERRKKLYQKNYPLWGGLTNMNMNSLWQPTDGNEPLDYLRAVSTGPTTPLVLSFTTAGEAANIGLSYRSTVFSGADIERMKSCFIGNLDELEVPG